MNHLWLDEVTGESRIVRKPHVDEILVAMNEDERSWWRVSLARTWIRTHVRGKTSFNRKITSPRLCGAVNSYYSNLFDGFKLTLDEFHKAMKYEHFTSERRFENNPDILIYKAGFNRYMFVY